MYAATLRTVRRMKWLFVVVVTVLLPLSTAQLNESGLNIQKRTKKMIMLRKTLWRWRGAVCAEEQWRNRHWTTILQEGGAMGLPYRQKPVVRGWHEWGWSWTALLNHINRPLLLCLILLLRISLLFETEEKENWKQKSLLNSPQRVLCSPNRHMTSHCYTLVWK